MKVSALIQKLAQLPGDAEIYMSQSSGDYWNTELAVPVSHVGGKLVMLSAYHDAKAVVEPRDGEEDVEGAVPVWVIE